MFQEFFHPISAVTRGNTATKISFCHKSRHISTIFKSFFHHDGARRKVILNIILASGDAMNIPEAHEILPPSFFQKSSVSLLQNSTNSIPQVVFFQRSSEISSVFRLLVSRECKTFCLVHLNVKCLDFQVLSEFIKSTRN